MAVCPLSTIDLLGIGLINRPPAISCTQGDIIKIHAYNGLGDKEIGTALHAHGMFFNGTNYYDGAVGVTQCSIPSEHGMDYIIDTSLQVSLSGTDRSLGFGGFS
jgi:iron transport multicopper oxidase